MRKDYSGTWREPQPPAFRIVLGCYPLAAETEKAWGRKDDPATEPGGWKDVAIPLPGGGDD